MIHNLKSGKNRGEVRAICLLILGSLIFEISTAPYAEASLWDERRRAAESQDSAKRKTQTAFSFDDDDSKGTSPLKKPSARNELDVKRTLSRSLLGFAVPEEIGTVVDAYRSSVTYANGEVRPLVIHIQDAHGTYGAQKNSARILKLLASSEPKSESSRPLLVAVEGAWGSVYTDWLAELPDDDFKMRLAESFLKQAEISGEEYLAILRPGTIAIRGMEEEQIYQANMKARRLMAAARPEILETLKQLGLRLDQLKPLAYSSAMASLDRSAAQFDHGDLSLNDYFRELSRHIPGQLLGAKPSLAALARAIELEHTLSAEKIESERETILEELSRKMDPASTMQLAQASLEFRTGQMTAYDYYQGLVRLASAHQLQTPRIETYLQYVEQIQKIDSENLGAELRSFEEEVISWLTRDNPLAESLAALSARIQLLQKFWSEKLSPDLWHEYQQKAQGFADPEILKDAIESIEKDLKINVRKSARAKSRSSRPTFNAAVGSQPEGRRASQKDLVFVQESYYRLAFKRDGEMLANALATARSENRDRFAMIAGGFHTNGITRLLRERNLSYVVIRPSLDESTNQADAGELSSFSRAGQVQKYDDFIQEYLRRLEILRRKSRAPAVRALDQIVNIFKDKLFFAAPLEIDGKLVVFGSYQGKRSRLHFAVEYDRTDSKKSEPAARNEDLDPALRAVAETLRNFTRLDPGSVADLSRVSMYVGAALIVYLSAVGSQVNFASSRWIMEDTRIVQTYRGRPFTIPNEIDPNRLNAEMLSVQLERIFPHVVPSAVAVSVNRLGNGSINITLNDQRDLASSSIDEMRKSNPWRSRVKNRLSMDASVRPGSISAGIPLQMVRFSIRSALHPLNQWVYAHRGFLGTIAYLGILYFAAQAIGSIFPAADISSLSQFGLGDADFHEILPGGPLVAGMIGMRFGRPEVSSALDYLDAWEKDSDAPNRLAAWQKRPDPLEVLNMPEIPNLPASQKYQDIVAPVDRVLPLMDPIVIKLLELARGGKVAILGRDAELFYDALKVILVGTPLEGNVILLPGSRKLWKKSHSLDEWRSFFDALGLDRQWAEGKQKLTIFDTGFDGSVIGSVTDRLIQLYGRGIQNVVDGQLIAATLNAKGQVLVALPYSNDPDNDLRKLFPTVYKDPEQLMAHQGLPTFSPISQFFVYFLEGLPHWNHHYSELKKVHASVIAVPSERGRSTHVDPLSALMLQHRVVNYFNQRRAQLQENARYPMEYSNSNKDGRLNPETALIGARLFKKAMARILGRYGYSVDSLMFRAIYRIFAHVISPLWEERLFREAVLSFRDYDLASMLSGDPVTLALVWGVSIVLFSLAHILFNWLNDRSVYSNRKILLFDFLKYLLPGLLTTVVYLSSAGSSVTAIADNAFWFSALSHSLYNAVALWIRERSESHHPKHIFDDVVVTEGARAVRVIRGAYELPEVRQGNVRNWLYMDPEKKAKGHAVLVEEGRKAVAVIAYPQKFGNPGVEFTMEAKDDNPNLTVSFAQPEGILAEHRGGQSGVRYAVHSNVTEMSIDHVIDADIRHLRDIGRVGSSVQSVRLEDREHEVTRERFSLSERKISFERRTAGHTFTHILEFDFPEDVEVLQTLRNGKPFGPVVLRSRSGTSISFAVQATSNHEPEEIWNADRIYEPHVLRRYRFMAGLPNIFNGKRGILKEIEALLFSSRFLITMDGMLAGSWRFLTPFGRDGLITSLALKEELQESVFESQTQETLDYMGDDGRVAHEVDYRVRVNRSRHVDRSMQDDDLLLVHAIEAIVDKRAEQSSDFFNKTHRFADRRRTESNADTIRRNIQYVLKLARESKRGGGMIALDRTVGNWRDSETGNVLGVYSFDINGVMMPEALRSLSRLLEKGADTDDLFSGMDREILAEELKSLQDYWDGVADRFKVNLDAAEIRARLIQYHRSLLRDDFHGTHDERQNISKTIKNQRISLKDLASVGLHPKPGSKIPQYFTVQEFLTRPSIAAHLEGNYTYFALSLDQKGNKIGVVNSDTMFKLFLSPPGSLSEEQMKNYLNPFLLPYAFGGLLVPNVGPVIANPMLMGVNPPKAAQTYFEEFDVQFPGGNEGEEIKGILGKKARLPLTKAESAKLRSYHPYALLTPKKYHGAVVWNYHAALLLKSLIDHSESLGSRAPLLPRAISALQKALDRARDLRNEELYSFEPSRDGKTFVRVPFKAEGGGSSFDEVSNVLQLWSLIWIAVDTRIPQMRATYLSMMGTGSPGRVSALTALGSIAGSIIVSLQSISGISQGITQIHRSGPGPVPGIISWLWSGWMIPRMQARGWSDRKIAGWLGAAEEVIFGALVPGAISAFAQQLGMGSGSAWVIGSASSVFLFMLSHLFGVSRYDSDGNLVTRGPPWSQSEDRYGSYSEYFSDLAVLLRYAIMFRAISSLPVLITLPLGPAAYVMGFFALGAAALAHGHGLNYKAAFVNRSLPVGLAGSAPKRISDLQLNQVDGILGEGERGLQLLIRSLRPEKEHGLPESPDRYKLRDSVWERISTHMIDRGGQRSSGRLQKNERFYWDGGSTRLAGHGLEEYDLISVEGFPRLLYFKATHVLVEFLPVIDNRTGKIRHVYVKSLNSKILRGLVDAAVHVELDSKGTLNVGMGKPDLEGNYPRSQTSWATFKENPAERGAVNVSHGIISRFESLESDLDERFSLLWRPVNGIGRVLTGFYRPISKSEFSRLSGLEEVRNITIRGGEMVVGGITVTVGGQYDTAMSGHVGTVRLIPSMQGVSLIGMWRVYDREGEVLETRVLKTATPNDSPEDSNSFERPFSSPLATFDRVLSPILPLDQGEVLRDYVVTGLKTNDSGELWFAGKMHRKLSKYPNAWMEIKVLDGVPRYVRLLYGPQGLPVVIELGSSARIPAPDESKRNERIGTDPWDPDRWLERQDAIVASADAAARKEDQEAYDLDQEQPAKETESQPEPEPEPEPELAIEDRSDQGEPADGEIVHERRRSGPKINPNAIIHHPELRREQQRIAMRELRAKRRAEAPPKVKPKSERKGKGDEGGLTQDQGPSVPLAKESIPIRTALPKNIRSSRQGRETVTPEPKIPEPRPSHQLTPEQMEAIKRRFPVGSTVIYAKTIEATVKAISDESLAVVYPDGAYPVTVIISLEAADRKLSPLEESRTPPNGSPLGLSSAFLGFESSDGEEIDPNLAQRALRKEEGFFSLGLVAVPSAVTAVLVSLGFMDATQAFQINAIFVLMSSALFGASHGRLYRKENRSIVDKGEAEWYHQIGFGVMGLFFRVGYLIPGLGLLSPVFGAMTSFALHSKWNHAWAMSLQNFMKSKGLPAFTYQAMAERKKNAEKQERRPIRTKEDVETLFEEGDRGIYALDLALRPESMGGIAQSDIGLRQDIWSRLLSRSFAPDEIRTVPREDISAISNAKRADYVYNLGHVVIRGKLPPSGHLELIEFMGLFQKYGNSEYELEINEGWPVRVFFKSDRSSFQFYPVMNGAKKPIDYYASDILEPRFNRYPNSRIRVRLSKSGVLAIGGGRPDVNGQRTPSSSVWGTIAGALPYEYGEISVRDGIIYRYASLERDAEPSGFSIVSSKSQGRDITSYLNYLVESEFNHLGRDHRIRQIRIDASGMITMGGVGSRQQVQFGKDYAFGTAEILEIANNGKQAFILKAQAETRPQEGEEARTRVKTLSTVHRVKTTQGDMSFETDDATLFSTFDTWRKSAIIQKDGKPLDSYIISGEIYSDEKGNVQLGENWGQFKEYPKTRVTLKVIDGEKRYLLFHHPDGTSTPIDLRARKSGALRRSRSVQKVTSRNSRSNDPVVHQRYGPGRIGKLRGLKGPSAEFISPFFERRLAVPRADLMKSEARNYDAVLNDRSFVALLGRGFNYLRSEYQDDRNFFDFMMAEGDIQKYMRDEYKTYVVLSKSTSKVTYEQFIFILSEVLFETRGLSRGDVEGFRLRHHIGSSRQITGILWFMRGFFDLLRFRRDGSRRMSDQRAAGIVGGAEEVIFSLALPWVIQVSLGSILEMLGLNPSQAILVAQFTSAILFTLLHLGGVYKYNEFGNLVPTGPPSGQDLLKLFGFALLFRLPYVFFTFNVLPLPFGVPFIPSQIDLLFTLASTFTAAAIHGGFLNMFAAYKWRDLPVGVLGWRPDEVEGINPRFKNPVFTQFVTYFKTLRGAPYGYPRTAEKSGLVSLWTINGKNLKFQAGSPKIILDGAKFSNTKPGILISEASPNARRGRALSFIELGPDFVTITRRYDLRTHVVHAKGGHIDRALAVRTYSKRGENVIMEIVDQGSGDVRRYSAGDLRISDAPILPKSVIPDYQRMIDYHFTALNPPFGILRRSDRQGMISLWSHQGESLSIYVGVPEVLIDGFAFKDGKPGMLVWSLKSKGQRDRLIAYVQVDQDDWVTFERVNLYRYGVGFDENRFGKIRAVRYDPQARRPVAEVVSSEIGDSLSVPLGSLALNKNLLYPHPRSDERLLALLNFLITGQDPPKRIEVKPQPDGRFHLWELYQKELKIMLGKGDFELEGAKTSDGKPGILVLSKDPATQRVKPVYFYEVSHDLLSVSNKLSISGFGDLRGAKRAENYEGMIGQTVVYRGSELYKIRSIDAEYVVIRQEASLNAVEIRVPLSSIRDVSVLDFSTQAIERLKETPEYQRILRTLEMGRSGSPTNTGRSPLGMSSAFDSLLKPLIPHAGARAIAVGFAETWIILWGVPLFLSWLGSALGADLSVATASVQAGLFPLIHAFGTLKEWQKDDEGRWHLKDYETRAPRVDTVDAGAYRPVNAPISLSQKMLIAFSLGLIFHFAVPSLVSLLNTPAMVDYLLQKLISPDVQVQTAGLAALLFHGVAYNIGITRHEKFRGLLPVGMSFGRRSPPEKGADPLAQLVLSIALLEHGGSLALRTVVTGIQVRLQGLIKFDSEKALDGHDIEQWVIRVNVLFEKYLEIKDSALDLQTRKSAVSSSDIETVKLEYISWITDMIEYEKDLIEYLNSLPESLKPRASTLPNSLRRNTYDLSSVLMFLNDDFEKTVHTIPVHSWMPSREWRTKQGRSLPNPQLNRENGATTVIWSLSGGDIDNDLKIEIVMDADVVSVTANEELLHMVLERLISNALKEILLRQERDSRDPDKEPLPQDLAKVRIHIFRSASGVNISVTNPGAFPNEQISIDPKTKLPRALSLNFDRPNFGGGVGLPFSIASAFKMGATVNIENFIENYSDRRVSAQEPMARITIHLPGTASAEAEHDAAFSRVQTILRSHPIQDRPDPLDVVELSEQDIRRLVGEQAFREYDSSKTLTLLRQILPYITIINLELLTREFRDHSYLFLGRDAENVFDAMKVLLNEHPDRALLLPASKDLLGSMINLKPSRDLTRRFLAQYGISRKGTHSGRQILIIDTGFAGSAPIDLYNVAKKLRIFSRISQLPYRLIDSEDWNAEYSLRKFNIPRRLRESLEVRFFSVAPSRPNNRFIAAFLQTLPRYFGPYRELRDSGDLVRAETRSVSTRRNIDIVSSINESVVNPNAALMVQWIIVQYFKKNRMAILKTVEHEKAKMLSPGPETIFTLGLNSRNLSVVLLPFLTYLIISALYSAALPGMEDPLNLFFSFKYQSEFLLMSNSLQNRIIQSLSFDLPVQITPQSGLFSIMDLGFPAALPVERGGPIMGFALPGGEAVSAVYGGPLTRAFAYASIDQKIGILNKIHSLFRFGLQEFPSWILRALTNPRALINSTRQLVLVEVSNIFEASWKRLTQISDRTTNMLGLGKDERSDVHQLDEVADRLGYDLARDGDQKVSLRDYITRQPGVDVLMTAFDLARIGKSDLSWLLNQRNGEKAGVIIITNEGVLPSSQLRNLIRDRIGSEVLVRIEEQNLINGRFDWAAVKKNLKLGGNVIVLNAYDRWIGLTDVLQLIWKPIDDSVADWIAQNYDLSTKERERLKTVPLEDLLSQSLETAVESNQVVEMSQ